MRRQDFTLTTRESTLAHWRFRNSLVDDSGNGHDLTGNLAGTRDTYGFRDGYAEDGISVFRFDGNDNTFDEPALEIAAAAAVPFDMGMNDFTIEAVMATDDPGGESIISKLDTVGTWSGWHFGMFGGNLLFAIGDGANAYVCQPTVVIGDNQYRHIAVTVDRQNGVARIYVDGAEVGSSPFDISAVTGNASAPAIDMRVGQNWLGYLDELLISAECLTSLAVAGRAAGRLVELTDHQPGFLMRFLPGVNHDNAQLEEFLRPFDTAYQQLRTDAADVAKLVRPHECPQRYLRHIAAGYDFPLINLPFATEAERRSMIPWIVWIYKRKGTISAVQKLIALLGFGSNITEVFAPNPPMILGFHRLWDLDLCTIDQKVDDFSSGLLDYGPFNSASAWSILNGRLRGVADASTDYMHGVGFANTKEVFLMEAEYEIQSTPAGTQSLGFFLKHVDAANYIRFDLTFSGGVAGLVITCNDYPTVLVTGLDPAQYVTGVHKLWIWADLPNSLFTAGLDDLTLVFEGTATIDPMATTTKGLGISQNLTVDWDNMKVLEVNRSMMTELFSASHENAKIQIELTGSPAFAASKAAYLEQVMPQFLPHGVDAEWI